MSAYCKFELCVYYMYLQYFDTVGWVFWPVKTVSHITYNLYSVGGDAKHCSIQLKSRIGVLLFIIVSRLDIKV